MSNFNSSLLIEAVQVWTGWGSGMYPTRDDARVEEKFGKETAIELLPAIKALQDDFYSSDARFVAADLATMGGRASEQFKRKHPTVPDEVVKAFAWCYTYDFK